MYARNILAILTLSLTVGAGCDVEVLEDGGEASTVKRSGSGGYGGVWLNTSAIGSQPFSEMDLAGALHDGVQVTGVKVKGANNSWILADKTEVADGTLRINEQGVMVPREIWIAEVHVISAKEARYTFQTHDDDGQVTYLCDADTLGSHSAAVIKDVTIDPFTADMAPRKATAYFACTSGAVGKAVTWGYRPWERTLAQFATAVRVVRADYCYDGMSWTENGTAPSRTASRKRCTHGSPGGSVVSRGQVTTCAPRWSSRSTTAGSAVGGTNTRIGHCTDAARVAAASAALPHDVMASGGRWCCGHGARPVSSTVIRWRRIVNR